MTPEEHADNICRWTNPALRERVIGEIRAALAETWRTMTTDPAREAARLACDLCHCCGEQRHDGGDPCVSCASAVAEERARLSLQRDGEGKLWICMSNEAGKGMIFVAESQMRKGGHGPIVSRVLDAAIQARTP